MEVIFAKYKDIKNYPPTKVFINRLEKARQEEDYKKSRMNGWTRSKSMVMTDLNVTPVILINNKLDGNKFFCD
jgi:hypothetical protein